MKKHEDYVIELASQIKKVAKDNNRKVEDVLDEVDTLIRSAQFEREWLNQEIQYRFEKNNMAYEAFNSKFWRDYNGL